MRPSAVNPRAQDRLTAAYLPRIATPGVSDYSERSAANCSIVTRAIRHLHVVVALLIATLLWVPAATRATQPPKAPAASTLRLNRGFDMPVDKQAPPPADLPSTIPAIARQDTTTTVATIRPAWQRDDALPEAPESSTPDPLRGPPASSLS